MPVQLCLPASCLIIQQTKKNTLCLLTDKSNRFSMIAESLGSAALAYRGLEQVTPHVFFDTTGCAFTFFVARLLAGCTVVAYVHYPTISTVSNPAKASKYKKKQCVGEQQEQEQLIFFALTLSLNLVYRICFNWCGNDDRRTTTEWVGVVS